jgi:CheY-like chemotaxis protein
MLFTEWPLPAMRKAKRILLIDDDADDQIYFKDAVNELSENLKCEVANNGQEALEKIEKPPLPDCIFLDLNMPVMNGYECLAHLRTEERYKDIPVVIFTTSKNSHDIDLARRMGANLFFTKPTNFNTLCSKLNKILDLDFSKMQFTY